MRFSLRFCAAMFGLLLAVGMNAACNRDSADADNEAATADASSGGAGSASDARSIDEKTATAANENSRAVDSTLSSGSSGVSASDTSPGLSGTSRRSGNSVGGAIDDAALSAKVKGALLADSDLKNLDLSVSTHANEVTLKGAADNQTQIDRASEIASNVDGVKEIQNRITIKR